MAWGRSGLRLRLQILVLLAVLPAVGLILYTASDQRRVASREVQQNALRLAKVAAADHELLVDGARHLLTALAQLPSIRGRDDRACTELLATLLKQYPRYANLGVIAPDGTTVCSGLPLSGPLNLADRGYFRIAVQRREFALGEYQIGRITGRASINFGYPVLENGQVRAVVFAALDLAWVNQLATTLPLPPGSAVTVVDRNGTILARHPDSERWVGKPAPETAIVQTMLSQREGTAESTGLDGITQLYGFTPLRSGPDAGGAYLSVGIPRAAAFSEANRILRRNLLGLGVVLVFVLGATWLFANTAVLRPMQALVKATGRLATGDLGARAGPTYGSGEVGQLARAFDEMAGALEVRHAELQRTQRELQRVNRALRVLSASNHALIRATGEAELFDTVCRTAVHAGGYRMAWIGFAEEDEAKRVRPVAWTGHEDGYLGAISVTWADEAQGQGPVGTAIRMATPRVVQHIATDPSFAPWRVEAARRGYGSIIALPLIAKEGPFGVLVIYASEPDAFDSEEVTLLTELAHDLAYGIAALRTQEAKLRAETEVERQREVLFRSEKLAALGRLAAGVGHELKNPLAVIGGRVKLLQMDIGHAQPLAPDQVARHVKSLEEAAERMRRIMEGLSTYSKPRKPEATLLRMGDLIEATRELVSYQARKSEVAIAVDATPDLPQIRGDRSQLMQVLLNLATNAIEAMADKGGQLTLRASVRQSRSGTGSGSPAPDRFVVVEVADTGPGIPVDTLGKIWDAFYTTKSEGTGLGLSIVRGLVEEQPGASIEVQSRPGEGTTFILALPVVNAASVE